MNTPACLLPGTPTGISKVYILLLLFSFTASAAAQQTGTDIRLGSAARDYRLPPDAAVEAIARHGNRYLMVFGTTEFDDSGVPVNRLLYTTFDSGATPRPPMPVDENESIPSGGLLALPANEGFFIFWNDRHPNLPGIRFRRFAFDGEPLGPSQRLDIGTGAPSPDRTTFQFNVLTNDAIPGTHLVQFDSGQIFTVNAGGTVRTTRTVLHHLQSAYFIAETEEIVVLHDTTLAFYTSLYDTAATARIPIPGLRKALPHSEVVTRDSTGGYRIIYAVVTDTLSFACTYYSQRVAPDSVGHPVPIAKDPVHYAVINGKLFPNACHGAVRQRGCNNRYRMTVRYRMWGSQEYHGVRQPIELPDYAFNHEVDGTGSFTAKDRFSTFTHCPDNEHLRLQRRSDSGFTTVSLILPNDTVELTVATAFVHLDIKRSRPNLYTREDNLVITWKVNPNETESGRWDTESAENPVQLFAPLNFSTPGRRPEITQEGMLWNIDTNIIDINGLTYAYRTLRRTDTAHSPTGYYKGTLGLNDIEVLVLSQGGWESIGRRTGYENPGWSGQGTPRPAPFISIRSLFDNYTSSLYCRITQEYYDTAYSSILSFNPDTGDWSDGIYRTFFNPDTGLSDRYPTEKAPSFQRISGHEWLRYYIRSDSLSTDGSSTWMFEVLGAGYEVLHSKMIQFNTPPSIITPAFNYSDRSIAVVWGGTEGIRAMFLDYSLNILERDVQISHTGGDAFHPSAAYRNDTLFVAWEDRRSGISEIYGSFYTAPKASGINQISFSEDHPLQISCTPNPASHTLLITGIAAGPVRPVFWSIHDLSGRRLWWTESKSGRNIEVNVSPFPPGIYILHGSYNGTATSQIFTVLR